MRFLFKSVIAAVLVPCAGNAIEAPAKAQSYLKRLEQRPQPGVMFDRFCDAFLTEHSGKELGAFLGEQPGHRLLLALWQRRQFQFDEARRTLTLVLEQAPHNAVALEQLVEVQLALKDASAAVATADRLIELKDLDETTRETVAQLRARCLWKAGRGDDALAQWLALLAEKPDDTDLQETCLDTLEREGKWSEVASLLSKWLPATQDAFLAMERRLRLARALLAQDKSSEALAALEEALARSAAGSWIEVEALAQMEPVHRRKDDVSGLSTALERLRKSNPGRVLLAMRSARVLGELGKTEGAREIHRDLLARVPGDRSLREEVAAQLMGWKLWDAAREQWQHLVSTYPQDAFLRLRLAEMLVRAGKPDEALAEARTFVQLQKGREPAWLQGAQVLASVPPGAAGITLLAEAGKALPDQLSIVRAHAEALTSARRDGEAKPLWIRLLKESGLDDVIVAVHRLRTMGDVAAEEAWALLLKRETEFASNRRYLQTLCDVALTTAHGKEAVPRALAFVRLSESATDTVGAIEWTAGFLRATDRLEPALQDWEGVIGNQAGEPLRTRILHAMAEELAQQSGRATALVQPAWEKVEKEKGSRLSPESALVAQAWLRMLTLRRDAGRAAAVMEVILSHTEERSGTLYQNATQLWEQAFQTEKALATAERWRAFAEGNPAAWAANARLLNLLGKIAEAQALLQQAARWMDADAGALAVIAEAQQNFGDPREGLKLALALYDRAGEDNARLNYAAMAGKAALLVGDAAFAEVVERFQQAQAREKSRALPALALFEVLRADRRTSTARISALLEAAVRAEPKNQIALARLAQSQQMAGEWKAAAETWRKLAALNPDADLQKALGQALIKAGELEEGLRITFAARSATVSKGPAASGNVEQDLTVADMLIAAGKPAQAAKVLASVDDYRARYLHAVALEEADEVQPAIEALLGVLSISQARPQKTESFWDRNAPSRVAWYDRWTNLKTKAYAKQNRQQFENVIRRYVEEGVPLPEDVREARAMALSHLARLAGYLPPADRDKLRQRALLIDGDIPASAFSGTEKVNPFASDRALSAWQVINYYSTSGLQGVAKVGTEMRDSHPAFALVASIAGLRDREGQEFVTGAGQVLERFLRLTPGEQQEGVMIQHAGTLMTTLKQKADDHTRAAARELASKWSEALESAVLAMINARSPDAAAAAENLCSYLVISDQWERCLSFADRAMPALREPWAMTSHWQTEFSNYVYSNLFLMPRAPLMMGTAFAVSSWSDGLKAIAHAPTAAQIATLRDRVLRSLLSYYVKDYANAEREAAAELADEPQNLDALWLRVLIAVVTQDEAKLVESLKFFVGAPWPAGAETYRTFMVLYACSRRESSSATLAEYAENAARELAAAKVSARELQQWYYVLHTVKLGDRARVLVNAAGQRTSSNQPRQSSMMPLPSVPSLSTRSAQAKLARPATDADPKAVAELAAYLMALAPRLLASAKDQELDRALSDLQNLYQRGPVPSGPAVLKYLEALVASGQGSAAEAGAALLLCRLEYPAARKLLGEELKLHPTNAGIRRLLVMSLAGSDPEQAARLYLDAPEGDREVVLPERLDALSYFNYLVRAEKLQGLQLMRHVIKEAVRRGESLHGIQWIAETFYSELWVIGPDNGKSGSYGLWCAPYREDISSEERLSMTEMLAVHDEICTDAIGVPSVAWDAFSMLAGSRMGNPEFDREQLAQEARRAMMVYGKSDRRSAHFKNFFVSAALCRWQPMPVDYLVWHAWQRKELTKELPDILAMAKDAGVMQEGMDACELLAAALQCKTEEFAPLINGAKKIETNNGGTLSIGLRAWDLRGRDVDITPLVKAALQSIREEREAGRPLGNAWDKAAWLGFYAGRLVRDGKEKDAESFLWQVCEALMGPKEKWLITGEKLTSRDDGIDNANQFLQAAVNATPRLLMPALRLRFSFANGDEQMFIGRFYLDNWLPAFCQNKGEALRRSTTQDQIAALLDGLAFVADDPPRPYLIPFEIPGGAGYESKTLLEAMAKILPASTGLRLQLSGWLEKQQKAGHTLGPALFAGLARGQKAEIVEAVVRSQDALLKMPAEVLGEWVGVLDRVLKNSNASEDALTDRAPKLWEEIKAQRLQQRRQYIDKIMVAKNYDELEPGRSTQNHQEFEKKIVTITDEVMGADFKRAQALMSAGLHLVDKEWMKQKWWGRSSYNGWNAASDIMENWMSNTKDLKVLAAGINILGAKDERDLSHACWPYLPATQGALNDAWREAGSLRDPVAAARSVVAELDKLLSPGPAPLLWFSLSDWVDKSDPMQRHDLERVALALRDEKGRAGEWGKMLEVALSFRRLTKKPVDDRREADIARVRTWFRSVAEHAEVNPMVKFGLTHYLMNRLHREMGRDEVLRAARLTIETMKLNLPMHAWTYHSVTNAMLALHADDEWKTVAHDLVEAWKVRSKSERAGTARAFGPISTISFGFFELGCRCYSEADVPGLSAIRGSNQLQAAVALAMLRGGHIALARNYLLQHQADVLTETQNNMRFELRDLPALKQMLDGISDGDRRLHAEAAVLSLAGGGTGPEHLMGWAERSWGLRLVEVGARWVKHEWKDQGLKRKALLALVKSPHAADAIFTGMSEDDKNAIMLDARQASTTSERALSDALRAWDLLAKHTPYRELRRSASGEQYFADGGYNLAQPSWERLACFGSAPGKEGLLKDCIATRMILENMAASNKSDAPNAALMSLHACQVAAADDAMAEHQWRDQLRTAKMRETLLALIKQKKELWSSLLPFLRTPDDKPTPVSERIAIVGRLLRDPWIAETLRDNRSLVAQLSENGVLTPAELRAYGRLIAVACPVHGSTAAAVALLCADGGDLDGAIKLMREAVNAATEEKRQALVVEFTVRLSHLLKQAGKEAEAAELLTKLPKESKAAALKQPNR